MTQEEFVEFLNNKLSEELDVRTLRKLERGRESCRQATLEIVARGLGCRAGEISKGPDRFRGAMMEEVIASTQSEIGATGSLAGILECLGGASKPKAAEIELLLALAVRRDVQGDSDGALRLGRMLARESMDCDPDLRARVLTRTASFCDHVGDPQRGLKILSPAIRSLTSRGGAANEQDWWMLFQYGTLLSSSGRLRAARRVLRKVRDTALSRALRVAALHQLGVIDLAHDKLDAAEEKFKQCLTDRHEMSSDDFRVAYEHRRLAEVCDRRGDVESARHHLQEADQIARRWSFGRYLDKLKPSSGTASRVKIRQRRLRH